MMADLLNIADFQPRPRLLCFDRTEMNLLLGLYARGAAAGDWQDYALDTSRAQALFLFYKTPQEPPILKIAKRFVPAEHGRKLDYWVSRGETLVGHAGSLSELLLLIDPIPRLILSDR